MKPILPWLWAWALLLPAGAPAQDDPLQALFAGGILAVAASGDGARLAFPGGDSLDLPLPPGAGLTDLAALADGWVLAGGYPGDDGRRRLLLLAGDGNRARRLPVPGGAAAEGRAGAVLLVEGGELAGLAWLEGGGARTLSVRASRRQGRGWGPVEVVSGPGPGSQLALAGAVLSDGSWLLTWSAFDGEDDEIVWSRRTEAGWRSPTRLSADNAVPDITPAVAAAGHGALAAWSRYDGGHYRLVLARLTGEGWAEERVIGGAGSLYPRFLATAGGPVRLLHREAGAGAWSLAEVTPRGRILRRASVASRRPERPLVAEGAGGAVRFRWPGEGGERIVRWSEEAER